MKSPKKTRATAAAETWRETSDRLAPDLGFEPSRKQIRLWKEKGFPLSDVEGLKAKLRNQERVSSGGPAVAPGPDSEGPQGQPMTPAQIDDRIAELEQLLLAAKDYETARTIRTQIQAIKDLIAVQQQRGTLMLTADAMAAGMSAGVASRGMWEKIAADLPPMLEGLTAMQMTGKLRDYARARCQELAEHFGRADAAS